MQLICQHSCCKNMLNGHCNSHLVVRPIVNYRIFHNANINIFWVSLFTQTLPIIVFSLLNSACHCVVTSLVRNLLNAFNFFQHTFFKVTKILKDSHSNTLKLKKNLHAQTCSNSKHMLEFFCQNSKKHASFEFS